MDSFEKYMPSFKSGWQKHKNDSFRESFYYNNIQNIIRRICFWTETESTALCALIHSRSEINFVKKYFFCITGQIRKPNVHITGCHGENLGKCNANVG